MPGFLNLDYGIWEGLTSEEAKAQDELAYAKYQTYAPDAAVPGGESLAARRADAARPADDRAAPPRARRSGGQPRRDAAAGDRERDRPPARDWRRELPNGSVCVFDVEASDVQLVRMPVACLRERR